MYIYMMFLVHRETRVTDTLYQFFHHLKFELCFLDFSDFLVVYIEDVDFLHTVLSIYNISTIITCFIHFTIITCFNHTPLRVPFPSFSHIGIEVDDDTLAQIVVFSFKSLYLST